MWLDIQRCVFKGGEFDGVANHWSYGVFKNRHPKTTRQNFHWQSLLIKTSPEAWSFHHCRYPSTRPTYISHHATHQTSHCTPFPRNIYLHTPLMTLFVDAPLNSHKLAQIILRRLALPLHPTPPAKAQAIKLCFHFCRGCESSILKGWKQIELLKEA